ncbi:hypothetical protein AAKU67_003972 [Oxalobacteraceae bacterium GrIS 2.11]
MKTAHFPLLLATRYQYPDQYTGANSHRNRLKWPTFDKVACRINALARSYASVTNFMINNILGYSNLLKQFHFFDM